MGRTLFRVVLAVAVGIVAAIAIAAVHPDPVTYQTVGEALILQPDGSYERVPLEGQQLKKGDVAHYVLIAKNLTNAPVAVESTLSVPLGTSYLGGTAASADSIVEFTTDDGSTWSGDPVAVGNAAKVTALRWRGNSSLAPGDASALEYMLKVDATFSDRADPLHRRDGIALRLARPQQAGGVAAELAPGALPRNDVRTAQNVTYRTVGEALIRQTDGSYLRRPLATATLSTGDLVHYLVIATNHSASQQTAAASLHIPAFTEYLNDGSNVGRAVIEFTTDGRTWSQNPRLGAGRHINALRWVLVEPLDPYESALVTFVLRITGPYADHTGDLAAAARARNAGLPVKALTAAQAQEVMSHPRDGSILPVVPLGAIPVTSVAHQTFRDAVKASIEQWRPTTHGGPALISDQTRGLVTTVRFNPARITFDQTTVFIIVISIAAFWLLAKAASRGTAYFAGDDPRMESSGSERHLNPFSVFRGGGDPGDGISRRGRR
jgi:hypothetical protein